MVSLNELSHSANTRDRSNSIMLNRIPWDTLWQATLFSRRGHSSLWMVGVLDRIRRERTIGLESWRGQSDQSESVVSKVAGLSRSQE
ncbi:hypothetical protein D3C76_1532460 [compost metagenome]